MIVLTTTAPIADKAVEVKTEKPAVRKKKKKIYLTFDDGPNRGTRNVLNIATQEQVPITFFIIGEHAFASKTQELTWDSLTLAPDSLVELCNHSYTHAWHNRFNSFYQSPDSVVKDFERCRDSLQLKNNIIRTPGRNTWRIDTIQFTDLKKSIAAVDSLQNAGFVVMGWDLEWHYDHSGLALKNRSDDLLNQIDSLFKKGKTKSAEHLVLLAHDQVYEDAEDSCELHQFIKKIKLKPEYELELATRYPGTRQ
ncbi:MAG: polysaccharide deacetylase family protein [Chitinophagaceae bacterium]|nr:polysaccharide deacetylase family protein [Chitinophagaceae bacterium]